MEKLGELDRDRSGGGKKDQFGGGGMKGVQRNKRRVKSEEDKARQAERETIWGGKRLQQKEEERKTETKKDRQREKWLDFSLLCMDQGESSLFNPI